MHLSEQSSDRLVETVLITSQGRMGCCDQSPCVDQVSIFRVDFLDRDVKLTVEKNLELEIEELIRQAENAQDISALDLLEISASTRQETQACCSEG